MLVDGGGTNSSSNSSPNGVSPKNINISSLVGKSHISTSPLPSQEPSPVKKPLTIERGRTLLDSSINEKDNLILTPSLIDVEARLANTPPHVLIRSISSLSQQSIRPRTPDPESNEGVGGVPAMRKGILLQARDRLFSRWKERYFVLTKDYLACFRRGTTKYSEMGSFIFKVNLATVDAVGWEDRRGGPVLALSLPREGKMLLRAKSGLDQWYRDLREATNASRNRRNALRRGSSTTHLNHIANNNSHHSPLFKNGSNLQFSLSDSTPEIVQLCESVCKDTSPGPARNISRPNRFSLVSNMDAGSCEGDHITPPSSVTSSNKFSSSTSSTSGSGGSSSLASSPSLRGSTGAWPRPPSPLRGPSSSAAEGTPRSRFSLYEGPRDLACSTAKARHSVCVEPRGLHADLTSAFRRRPLASDALRGSRSSLLCLHPRNPLLDLLEGIPSSTTSSPKIQSGVALASPAKSEPPLTPSSKGINTPPSPSQLCPRPRAHSTSVTPQKGIANLRSRTNLAIFRHSAVFN
ncbi:UNVERIFIED_CONTAM: hypothetical protein RMT77_017163 [Armadillidium vulgare]